MSLSSSQSHFLNLKLGENLMEVCWGNPKLKEEVHKLQMDLEDATEKEQRLTNSN